MTITYLFERNCLLREGLKSYLVGTPFHVTAEFDCINGYLSQDDAHPPDACHCGSRFASSR